jgi:hypothetical protein
MRISQAFPSLYLRPDDFDEGQELKCTISTVEREISFDKEKPVLHFADGLKLRLSLSDAWAIASKLGDETDDWRGHVVYVFRTTINYPKPDTPCLRVRIPQDRAKVDEAELSPLPQRGNGDDSNNNTVSGEEVPF